MVVVKTMKKIAIIMLCLLMTGLSSATTKIWSGGNGDWWTAGNWTPSGVPVTGDDVTIGTLGNTVVLSNSAPASGYLSSL